MKSLIAAMVASCCAVSIAAGGSPGPSATWPTKPITAPLDRAYPGEISLQVDASDFERRIVRVREHISGIGTDSVLLYPKWLPGTHAPEGTIDRFAGLKITAAGAPVPWMRDPVDVFAFRLRPAAGIKAVDIEFQYLSPTSMAVGEPEISREMLALEWNEVLLYPAGYFTRRIPVSVSLTLPADWKFATALQTESTSGAEVRFQPTELNTLVDSPVYAGRYVSRLDLDSGNAVPVHLNLFADRPEQLKVKPEQLDAYRALVQQGYRLFGSHHYAHYDFLYSLSDQIADAGLEHHQSSENGGHPESFTDWDKFAFERDLLPHEYTHSWNGKFRRPADLWTPNFNVPMQNSLLWVYEGQTEYWGHVLAARAALRTHQQTLDEMALRAAYYQVQTGRQWRSVQDTTNDEIINPRRPMSWRDWQRYEDYYSEGSLIWLDADTLIRERSQGKRSLDDFARAFFGINDGSIVPVTYTFDDVVKTLNAVEPYDWATFLHQRIDRVDTPVPLDGLHRGGYKLVYNDTPNELLKDSDQERKRLTLTYSIGIQLSADDKDGTIDSVFWNSPAFKAGLIESAQILAVNGIAYSDKVIEDAISAAQKSRTPIELIVKTGDRYRVASLEYYDGLRYPHLERDPAEPARLDDILKARQ
ncbi:MAG TPA: hypothetical protein VGL28_10110 [Steroidobacteraceae bacterium]|jgi:predicted metalloprotease with PDZ domain